MSTVKTYVGDVHVGTLRDLSEKVARLEDLGVDGYLHGDHLFMGGSADAAPAADPFSTLAAVGALSDRLVLGTLVANVGFCHPALVLRHFVQLAALFGGERVLAGIGAGWNAEEFEALGTAMPPLASRMEHLTGAAELARAWFDAGTATVSTATFSAHELPMAPPLDVPPRLMVGGGSPRVMRLAGRLADDLDLHPLGPARSSHTDQTGRFLETTMDDARKCVEALEDAERAAGRVRGSVTRSMWMGFITFCTAAEYAATEERLCRDAGVEPRDLRECPYVLVGEPAQMAELIAQRRDRLGLDAVVMGTGPELDRFMTEVVPLI